MGTLDPSLHDGTWYDAQFSDSEARRLFSSDRFHVEVRTASRDGE